MTFVCWTQTFYSLLENYSFDASGRKRNNFRETQMFKSEFTDSCFDRVFIDQAALVCLEAGLSRWPRGIIWSITYSAYPEWMGSWLNVGGLCFLNAIFIYLTLAALVNVKLGKIIV